MGGCNSDENVRYLGAAVVDKRDRFVAELREDARARGLAFRLEKGRGKGGHAMLWVGERFSTLPSREIDPKTARKIRKALGL
jgi:hypothetical protein